MRGAVPAAPTAEAPVAAGRPMEMLAEVAAEMAQAAACQPTAAQPKL
jgi:hypothetical protein